jgi:pimeloyl-ACP methyl ester carboxylesterase
MVEVPDVRYVRRDGVNVAYTRWGQGSHVAVFTPPLVSNVELAWESDEWARTSRYAGEHHQVIMIDKRGVGLSDRVSEAPTLDERVLDTLAVMDAEQLDAAHLIGQSEGGLIAIAIAARFPERVRSLSVMGAPAMGVPNEELAALADDDNPLPDAAQQAEFFRSLLRHWTSPESVNLDLFAPTVAGDVSIRRWYRRFERQSASPGALLMFLRSFDDVDIRPFLAEVRAPTLVTHMRHDRIVHVANGRYLHTRIPGARYVEYEGADHLWVFSPQWRQIHDDAIEFITGVRPTARTMTRFATVLFTDIVDSTSQEAALGNSAWLDRLDRHDRIARRTVETAGGTFVKQTGDGLLALFPDPGAAVQAGMALACGLAEIGLPIRCGVHAGIVEVRGRW